MGRHPGIYYDHPRRCLGAPPSGRYQHKPLQAFPRCVASLVLPSSDGRAILCCQFKTKLIKEHFCGLRETREVSKLYSRYLFFLERQPVKILGAFESTELRLVNLVNPLNSEAIMLSLLRTPTENLK